MNIAGELKERRLKKLKEKNDKCKLIVNQTLLLLKEYIARGDADSHLEDAVFYIKIKNDGLHFGNCFFGWPNKPDKIYIEKVMELACIALVDEGFESSDDNKFEFFLRFDD